MLHEVVTDSLFHVDSVLIREVAAVNNERREGEVGEVLEERRRRDTSISATSKT